MSIEELAKKVENNAKRLDENAENINKNVNAINDNLKQIQKNSGALDLLRSIKSDNKRLFIILIMVLIMWFLTIGYLVYVLNDIGVVEEITTQEVNDIDTINGNVVNSGDVNG